MSRGSSQARDMIGTEIVESDRDANVHRSWSDCSASIALSLLSRAKLSLFFIIFAEGFAMGHSARTLRTRRGSTTSIGVGQIDSNGYAIANRRIRDDRSHEVPGPG
jgi:hypothetical protein